MERSTAIFVDGMGAAAATSGILTQQQARIFALLFLSEDSLSLDGIAEELELSKSNVSVNVRVLVEWHLVRLRKLPGSRRDHYEAATDFFRAMQEIFERRFRWTVRQVLAAVRETRQALAERDGRHAQPRFVKERLDALASFFEAVDAGIGLFVQGRAFPADTLRKVVPLRRQSGG